MCLRLLPLRALALLCSFLAMAGAQNNVALVTNEKDGMTLVVSESITEITTEKVTSTVIASPVTTSTRPFSNFEQEFKMLNGGYHRIWDMEAISSICAATEWPDEDKGYFVRCSRTETTEFDRGGKMFYGATSIWTEPKTIPFTSTGTNTVTIKTVYESPTPAPEGNGEEEGNESEEEEKDEESRSDKGDEEKEEGEEEFNEESSSEGGKGTLTITNTEIVDLNRAQAGNTDEPDSDDDGALPAYRPRGLSVLSQIAIIAFMIW